MIDHPLRPVCTAWISKIRAAIEVKKKIFSDDADEAMRFFNGPYDWLYSQGERSRPTGMFVDDDDWPQPSMRMTTNKVAEMVQLFGPVLYHKNPYRMVNPRQFPDLPLEMFGPPNDPRVQQSYLMVQNQAEMGRITDRSRALLVETLLNYTPNELNLKDETRLTIDETIIKGMGTLWTEVYTVPMSGWRMVGSFFDTVDNLIIDPDSERFPEEAHWIARRCCHPVWMIEQEYNLPPGSVKGNLTTWNNAVDADSPQARMWAPKGQTADLLVYWKVYSKMGMGGRLNGVNPAMRPVLDAFGDYAFLAVADNLPYPLNLPPEVIAQGSQEDVGRRLQWPTPFWKDGGWPVTPFVFHPVARSAWPMSHVKPAMGELKFLNWAFSFLASRMKVTSRQFIALSKSADEELRKSIMHGPDLTILEIDVMNKKIEEVVQFLQQPPMNKDLFTVIQAVSDQFDKRTGLTELMYGESPRQMRSASEAEVKSDQLKVRPDDMTSRVEEAMTEVAKKEALASRWHLRGPDVLPIIGPAAAYFWDQLCATDDPDALTRSLEYRIEANSTRKPNRERQAQNMSQAMQTLLQPLYAYAQTTGNVGPVNALIADWAKSIDLNAQRYLLSQPPPPSPAPAPAPGGGPPQKEPSQNGRAHPAPA